MVAYFKELFTLTNPGQVCGLIATLLCFIMPLFKKKWQILTANGFINVFFALNLLFIHEIGSGIVMNCVAIVQTLVAFWHLFKKTKTSMAENIVFLLLNVGFAAALLLSRHLKGEEITLWLELLPLIAAAFNTLAIFQPDEQKTRVLIFFNASIYFSYYCVLGATSMFAELLAAITAVIGLIRYRKPKKAAK